MVFFSKHKAVHGSRINRLGIVGLLSGFSLALVSSIWALYMNEFFNNISVVGLFSALLTFFSIMTFFLIVPVLEKRSKSRIFGTSILMFSIIYLIYFLTKNIYIFIIVSIFSVVVQAFRVTSFGIIIKDSSSKKSLARNEGFMFTLINISFVIGPLVAGLISEKFGINVVFLLASIFMFITFIFFKISEISDFHSCKKVHKNLWTNFYDFFSNRDRVNAYFLRGGANLWWSLIYLYIPLYLYLNGLSKAKIGLFLFFVAIPLILFEFYFGKVAGKVGFKKLFILGYIIPAIISLICFFITDIFLMMVLLVVASVGLSMLEGTAEAYFFDILKKGESSRFYAPYSTTLDLNLFIGKFLPAIGLLFLDFKYVFLIYSMFMFLLFIMSFFIKDIKEI